ncbi:cation-translocating P-type ATPase [Acidimicrobiaceae bacterium]|nr:cation-translocating P-type ATPase [Acidimicrobiaceae bacterium]
MSSQNNTLNLDIEGMTCAACAARIERVISKQEDVLDVSVSFPLKSAIVDIKNNDEFDVDNLIKKVNTIGYKAKEADSLSSGSKVRFKFLIPLFSLFLTYILRFTFEAGLDILSYAIGSFVILILGRNFHISAFKKIKFLDFNMDTLISIGSLSALIISLLPSTVLSSDLSITNNKMFLDTGAFIVSFILIGKAIEDKVIEESVNESESIKSRMPKTLIVERGGEHLEVPIKEVTIGDLFKVSPGEIIPVDGVVLEGSTTVDESLLTGESIPLVKNPGDLVVGGSINLDGALKVSVQESYQKSTYNIIEELIRTAQATKPEIQKSLDKVTQYFVPVVLFISLLTFLFRFFISDFTLLDALKNSIAVLVIACPCALGLATPIVLFKTATLSKKQGYLFKNFDILQKFGDINTLIFDKTGTLSSGIFKISKIDNNTSLTENTILQIIASLENYSQHPIARSIVYEAELRDLKLLKADNVKEVPGLGIQGIVDEKKVLIEKNEDSNESSIIVKIDEQKIDLYLEEEVSVSSNFLNILKDEKEIIILSGDKEVNVEKFARSIGVDKYHSNKSPEEKLDFIKNKQLEEKIIYVGDGVNDSPSIKQADIGITTSSSSQIAQVAGDILIHKGGLDTISEIFKLSKKSKSRIYQNLFLAFVYNTSMIPLAVYGAITPNLAALAMALSSISVVLNSSRKL